MGRLKFMNQNGFSLPEMITVIAIEGVAILIAIVVISQLLGSQIETVNSQSISTHELEVRATMRRENATHSNTVCFDTLNALIPSTELPHIIDIAVKNKNNAGLAGMASSGVDSLDLKDPTKGYIDFSNLNKTTGFQKYGNLSIIKTELTDFRVLRSIQGYYLTNPGYFSKPPGGPSDLMYVLSALVKTSFVPVGQETNLKAKKYTSAVRINLAIRRIGSNYTFLSCGTKPLAEYTAPLEACKAFGKAFEYVYDQASNLDRGQCYVPVYDPTKSNPVLGTNPDGTRLVSPTGYIPLKEFFCEGAPAGKSLNNPFCTGIK